MFQHFYTFLKDGVDTSHTTIFSPFFGCGFYFKCCFLFGWLPPFLVRRASGWKGSCFTPGCTLQSCLTVCFCLLSFLVPAVANESAPVAALRPGFLSTFALATDQGSKLGLSKNKSIICYYNDYQVSPHTFWPSILQQPFGPVLHVYLNRQTLKMSQQCSCIEYFLI